jgi:hypothetical protein
MKRSPSQVFVKRVGSAFPTLKALAIKKSIELLRELIHVVEIPIILKTRGLFHVHLLLDWPVEESALHIHLEQPKRVVSGIG